jgi:hypothetical protein
MVEIMAAADGVNAVAPMSESPLVSKTSPPEFSTRERRVERGVAALRVRLGPTPPRPWGGWCSRWDCIQVWSRSAGTSVTTRLVLGLPADGRAGRSLPFQL